MILRLPLLFVWLLATLARAAEPDALNTPANRVAPEDPAWLALAAGFARQPDTTAEFTEQRFFPFKKAPVDLRGTSRVSAARGLSLHYTAPDERIVILDAQGVLLRDARGEVAAPEDPRAGAAQAALVQVLRFDLPKLAESFEIFGRRTGETWTLAFVPRDTELRRTVGQIIVAGGTATVSRIELRRSARQSIVISIGPARPAPFTPEEQKRFFR